MNTTPVSRAKAFVTLALLLALSVACSSASPTDTAEIEWVTEKEGDAEWSFEIRTWVDKDGDGVEDTREEPLHNVHVWVDFVEESGLIIRKDTGSTTNQDGVVCLVHGGVFHIHGEQCYGFCYTDCIVRSEVPAVFNRTTPARITCSEHQGGPYLFGFTYIDTPTPEPTSTPSP